MLFCVCSHTLSEIAFLLFERKILVGLDIRCKKRSPFGKCVFNLGVESTVLRVTPGTEASQAMAGSFCAQNRNKKNAEIQKDRPHTGKHSPQPKATGRLSIPVVQQSLERERGKHVHFQQRGSAHTTTCQRCRPRRWGHVQCRHWGESTVTIRLAGCGLVATSPGDRVREQRPQQIPWREKGKALLWESSVQDLLKLHRCSPSLGSAHPRRFPHGNSCTTF